MEHNNNYDAKINIKLYASARTRPLKLISMSASCVRTRIYIEDMRTKKVSECAVTSERIVFSLKPRIVMSCPRCVDSFGIRILWLRSI